MGSAVSRARGERDPMRGGLTVTCHRLAAGFACVSDNLIDLEHEGRRWRVEVHRYLGPMVLRADGEPRVRQPGPRSPFWTAWEARYPPRTGSET